MSLSNYTPGQFTKPAAFTLAPPPGRKLWCVWTETRADARALVSALLLLAYPPEFGVETWEGQERALVVIDEPVVSANIVRVVIRSFDMNIIESLCSYDMTGAFARGAKCLKALA